MGLKRHEVLVYTKDRSMKNVLLTVAFLWVGGLQQSWQFGIKLEEGAYRRVVVHISGVDEPENCGNFLAKFEVRFFCTKTIKQIRFQNVGWKAKTFQGN